MTASHAPSSQADAPDTSTSPAAWAGVAAVVAPYGSGAYYCAEFARHGWRCVAVTSPNQTVPSLSSVSLNPAEYAMVVVHGGNLHQTARTLHSFGVRVIVAGAESGVELADRLTECLGLPGNDPATSDLRRDKGAMAAALADAGLAAPRSLSTDRLNVALSWASDCGLAQFVVKPADSTGANGVHICSSSEEIRSAWHALQQSPNAMGGADQLLVIQERLQGRRYIVNSVSAESPDGEAHHTVTEIWSDIRTEAHLADRADLLSRRAPLLSRAIALYTMQALDALGITTGPTHNHVMYVPARGPVLIDSGAHPDSSYEPSAIREATGSDHIRDAVHTAISGQAERLAPHRSRTRVTRVSLIAPYDGAFDEQLLRTVVTLPTVTATIGNIRPGFPVRRTVDLTTSPGQLILASEEEQSIDQDYKVIRAVEAIGLYDGAQR